MSKIVEDQQTEIVTPRRVRLTARSIKAKLIAGLSAVVLILVIVWQWSQPAMPHPDIDAGLSENGYGSHFISPNEAFVKEAIKDIANAAKVKAYGFQDKEKLTSADGEAVILIKQFQEAQFVKNSDMEKEHGLFIASGNPSHIIRFDDKAMMVSVCSEHKVVLKTRSGEPLSHSLVRHLPTTMKDSEKRERTTRVTLVSACGQTIDCLRDEEEFKQKNAIPSMSKHIYIVGGHAVIKVKTLPYQHEWGTDFPTIHWSYFSLFGAHLTFELADLLMQEDGMAMSASLAGTDFLTKRDLVSVGIRPGGGCRFDERSTVKLQNGANSLTYCFDREIVTNGREKFNAFIAQARKRIAKEQGSEAAK